MPEKVKGGLVYCASKVGIERAGWKFVEENKPKFVFNAVLPNVNVSSFFLPVFETSLSC
jgi:hypothetical protein